MPIVLRLKTLCAKVIALDIKLINKPLPDELFELIQHCINTTQIYTTVVLHKNNSYLQPRWHFDYNNAISTERQFISIVNKNCERGCNIALKLTTDNSAVLGGYYVSRLKNNTCEIIDNERFLIVFITEKICESCGIKKQLLDINYNPISVEQILDYFEIKY
jgi:hypothetical protein